MRLVSKPVLIGAGIAAVAAGAGAFIWMTHGAAGVRYRTAAATVGTVTQTVSLSGNLTPVGETDLSFGGSGKVTAVDVEVGQQVSAGQVLATLDTSSSQSSLTIAQANLNVAQARLSLDEAGPTAQSMATAQAQVTGATVTLQNDETAYSDTVAVNQQAVQQAQSQLQQDQQKYNSDGCSLSPPASTCTPQDQSAVTQDSNAVQAATVRGRQADDQASGQVNMARAQLQSAQASLRALEQGSTPQQVEMDQSQVQIDQVNVSSAQATLNDGALTATAGGVVAAVNVSAGQVVGSSGSGSGGSAAASSSSSPAVVIITPGAFEVTGNVSDALVSEIAMGQRAQIVVAGSNQAQTGSVTAIAQQATISSGVASFPVSVTLDGTDPALRDGMSASVSVVVNQVVEVLTVPTSAVHTTAGATTVQVLVNGLAQTRTVQVGAADALRTQIVSGLNPGDEVIIATVSANVPTTSGAGLFGGGGGLGGGRAGGATRGAAGGGGG
jgi:multidrug efflux pump subunit AcrA (membrane-fusion protein)